MPSPCPSVDVGPLISLMLRLYLFSDRLPLHNDYLIMNLFYLIPRSHAQFLYPIVSWLRRMSEIGA